MYVYSDMIHHPVGGLAYPSEKYEFANWDDDIPNIWKKQYVPKHPPSQCKSQRSYWINELHVIKHFECVGVCMKLYCTSKYFIVWRCTWMTLRTTKKSPPLRFRTRFHEKDSKSANGTFFLANLLLEFVLFLHFLFKKKRGARCNSRATGEQFQTSSAIKSSPQIKTSFLLGPSTCQQR